MEERVPVLIDADQYQQVSEYCAVIKCSKVSVVREAVTLWLRDVAGKRLTAFRAIDTGLYEEPHGTKGAENEIDRGYAERAERAESVSTLRRHDINRCYRKQLHLQSGSGGVFIHRDSD